MSNQDAEPQAPGAFLSHASEDKATFVEPLGRELAALGIRPWLDKWEILPGDSLVQKLFDEGLAHVDVVIIAISAYSVDKPWVREELDNATVKRITRGTRLIPVRLDGTEMPAPLQHLAWINAERTTESVKQTAQKIADTMHGHDPRPEVASPPAYAKIGAIPGLTRHDTVLLIETVHEALSFQDPHPWLDWNTVKERAYKAGLSEAALMESREALVQTGCITLHYAGGGVVTDYELTDHGYTAGIRAAMPDYDDVRQRIIAVLINDPPTGKSAIEEVAERADANSAVVDRLLDELESGGLIDVIRTFGGTEVPRISPTLARMLQ